jgi:hypothetical protein
MLISTAAINVEGIEPEPGACPGNSSRQWKIETLGKNDSKQLVTFRNNGDRDALIQIERRSGKGWKAEKSKAATDGRRKTEERSRAAELELPLGRFVRVGQRETS